MAISNATGELNSGKLAKNVGMAPPGHPHLLRPLGQEEAGILTLQLHPSTLSPAVQNISAAAHSPAVFPSGSVGQPLS